MTAWYVFVKELKSYFVSPVCYAASAVFLLIGGYLFSLNLVLSQRVDFFPQLASALVFLMLFLVPALTMRLFAEERSQRTMALLLTSPVSNAEIVAGKFAACFAYLMALLAVTGIYPWVLARYGTPDLGIVASSYLGAVLVIGCFVAVGLFASSLTESQMMSAVLGFGVNLFFWMVHFLEEPVRTHLADGAAEFVKAASLHLPLVEFLTGAIHMKYVVFYLGFAGFFLFLAHRQLSSNSWR